VQLTLDYEQTGIAIQPIEGQLFRLEGIVPGGGARLSLFADTGRFEVEADEDGRFHFDRLAPGSFLSWPRENGAGPSAGGFSPSRWPPITRAGGRSGRGSG